MLGWLSRVFLQEGTGGPPPSREAGGTLKRWRCHVQRFFYRQYASMRIEELFGIIRGQALEWRELGLTFEKMKCRGASLPVLLLGPSGGAFPWASTLPA